MLESATQVIARKQAERTARLQTASVYDPETHDPFLRASVSEITKRIVDGQWTAAIVLEAYIARAAHAHAETNCLTEVMFESARQHARALDAEFAERGQLRGPLHGVPMTVKDQYEVKGYDVTIGFTQWAGRESSTNAEAVELLISAGAIPFVKTNVPQTMLAFECANPLWGRTLNPHAHAYTCGGSSGGEGALLASAGAVLGLGSDIGGSLRIPAAYCGVFALKPGFGRVPYGGGLSSAGGNENIRTVAGPMARSVQDLVVAARVLFGASDKARDVAPVPFRDVELPQKLKFGFYVDDGFVRASPANERAVREAAEALRARGHECVEIDWPYNCEPARIFSSLQSADAYKTLLSPLGSDPQDDSLFLAVYPPLLPRWLRSTLAWIIERFVDDAQYARMLRGARPRSVRELYEVICERNAHARAVVADTFDAHGFDGLLAPVQALPVIPHQSSRDLAPLANATMQYNIAGLPVGVVPVTRVDPARDALPRDATGAPAWPASAGPGGGSRIVTAAARKVYDEVRMAGVPVAVQLVGRTWEDEKVLAMMGVLDDALGERGFGPGMLLAKQAYL